MEDSENDDSREVEDSDSNDSQAEMDQDNKGADRNSGFYMYDRPMPAL
jgi:hypothetical protein